MTITMNPEKILEILRLLDVNARSAPELYLPLQKNINESYYYYQSAQKKVQEQLEILNQQSECARSKLAEIKMAQERLAHKMNETESEKGKKLILESFYELELASEEYTNIIKEIEEKRQAYAIKWEELIHYSHCFEDGQEFLQRLQNNGGEICESMSALSKKTELLAEQLINNR